MKLKAQAYHINCPFGQPVLKDINRDTCTDEEFQKIAGDAALDIIYTMRIRGFSLMDRDMSIRLSVVEN